MTQDVALEAKLLTLQSPYSGSDIDWSKFDLPNSSEWSPKVWRLGEHQSFESVTAVGMASDFREAELVCLGRLQEQLKRRGWDGVYVPHTPICLRWDETYQVIMDAVMYKA